MTMHQISTPPATSRQASPSLRPVSGQIRVPSTWSENDILDAAPRAAGSDKLPQMDQALVRRLLVEIAPQVEELTGLKVVTMPNIALVAHEALYQRAALDLQHDSHLAEDAWRKARSEAVAVLGPKRLWRAPPAVYQPRTNALAVVTDGMRGKNYDSMRLWLLGSLITCAAYQAYPEYVAGLDEAWLSYVDKLTNFGPKGDAAQSAKETFLSRQCLVGVFAEHWRRKAKPRYYPQAVAPSAGLVGNIAALCSKNMRSVIWRAVKTDSILKQYYDSPREFGGDFIAKLFKTPADQDYFLTQHNLGLAYARRNLENSLTNLQATMNKLQEDAPFKTPAKTG